MLMQSNNIDGTVIMFRAQPRNTATIKQTGV